MVLGPESTGKSTLCEALARHFSTIWCPEYAREYLLANGTDYTFDDLLTIAQGQLALEEDYLKRIESREDGKSASQQVSKLVGREAGRLERQEEGIGEERTLKAPQASDCFSHPNTFGLSDFRTFQTSDLPAQKLLFIDTDQYVMKVWCEYVFGDCHNWILNQIAQRPYDLYLLCKPDLPWVKDELREYPDEKPRQELYHIYKDLLLAQQVPWAEISGDYDNRVYQAVQVVNSHFVRGK